MGINLAASWVPLCGVLEDSWVTFCNGFGIFLGYDLGNAIFYQLNMKFDGLYEDLEKQK